MSRDDFDGGEGYARMQGWVDDCDSSADGIECPSCGEIVDRITETGVCPTCDNNRLAIPPDDSQSVATKPMSGAQPQGENHE